VLLTHWLFLEGVQTDFIHIYIHTHRHIYKMFFIHIYTYIITSPCHFLFNLTAMKPEFQKEQFSSVSEKVALPFMCFRLPEALTPQILF